MNVWAKCHRNRFYSRWNITLCAKVLDGSAGRLISRAGENTIQWTTSGVWKILFMIWSNGVVSFFWQNAGARSLHLRSGCVESAAVPLSGLPDASTQESHRWEDVCVCVCVCTTLFHVCVCVFSQHIPVGGPIIDYHCRQLLQPISFPIL